MARLRGVLSALLSFVLLVPPPSWAAAAARTQLESLSGGRLPASVFDGSRIRAAGTEWLPDAKDILARGTKAPDGRPILPFTFNITDGGKVTAPSAGLEGFYWAEREVRRIHGKEAVMHHLADYFSYIDALLAPVSWSAEARQELRAIAAQDLSPGDRYDRLMEFVSSYTDKLRRAVSAADAAGWARSARVYELFPRAYNLRGRRQARGGSGPDTGKFFADCTEDDLRDIQQKGFDAIWAMGIMPIGERNRWGTGGGSPYSVRDHEGISPDLGTIDDFRNFVAKAHSVGMRVIMDFIPNHTSMDSKLLKEHPEYFVHRDAGQGEPPRGYFEQTAPNGRKLWVRNGGYDAWGTRDYWTDTAQVDYSNPGMRREMVRIVGSWISRTGVDGFRVDMAYQVTNAYFGRNWAGELGAPLPRREFLEELITEAKGRWPGTAFLCEAYDRFDDLSNIGFDLIYSKNNMDRPGGHTGLYDALTSKDPGWIREALRRQAFLDWQRGGMAQIVFTGNHDEVSPQRALGPWMAGATFLTLLMPGAQLFYGSSEIGFDAAVDHEHKPIPFSVPVSVDWQGAKPDVAAFYDQTFKVQRWLKERMGETVMEALPPEGYPRWVGYLLWPNTPKEGSPKAVAVLANPTDQTVTVEFTHPRLGAHRSTLAPYGYDLVSF